MIATLDLDSMTTEELREQLIEELEFTKNHLLRAAQIWVKLKDRPDADLDEFRGGIFPYLELIASGEVLPDIVHRFFGDDRLCKAFASLPVPKQKELLEVGAVPLAVFEGESHTHRMISLDNITRSQIPLIFDGPRIRSVEEQRQMLTPPTPQPWKRRKRRTRIGRVTVDRIAGTVSISGGPAPVEDVVKALRGAGVIP